MFPFFLLRFFVKIFSQRFIEVNVNTVLFICKQKKERCSLVEGFSKIIQASNLFITIGPVHFDNEPCTIRMLHENVFDCFRVIFNPDPHFIVRC